MHGYLSCKESFYYQTEYFKDYFEVIAPDMPGFGASGALCKPYSVSDYAAWLADFLKGQNAARVNIIAHSFGARVAIKTAAERPQTVNKLVITGGAGIVKPRSSAYIRRVKRYRAVKKIFPRFAEKHFGSAEYRTLSPVMKESYKKIVNEDLSPFASAINCPTLLIYGKDDTVTPPDEEGKIFNGLIAGSKLCVMEGGHFCFSERPDVFNKIIMDFLRCNDGNFYFGS